MYKEIFMEEQERIAAELEDQGITPAVAYEIASDRAYDAMVERLADNIDRARQQWKDRTQ